MREGKRAQGREAEEEVLAVGTRRRSGSEGGGVVKRAFSAF